MEDDFIVIAITPPDFYPEEAERIVDLLEKGEVDFVHIRKPDATAEDIRSLILQIDAKWHSFLKLHDQFELTREFHIGGCHLNSRNPASPENVKSLSKSIHSIDEIDDNQHFEYIFLSPVFDSISKKGYKANIKLDGIQDKIFGKNVIALGGVTPDKFPLLKKSGFKGAAMLGHFFPSKN